MLALDSGRLAAATIPPGTGWLLGACMEARGNQDLWMRQKPEALAALREQAMIQSAESSNRIEGVTVVANRLRPLVLGAARPRDRSEKELAWKRRNNEIIEVLPNGQRRIRFAPTAARDTPKAMEALCRRYQQISEEELIPPLLTVATFVFDLFCVHPFRDGNGRVSRLATTLLLQAGGFEVVRYVSLERLVEERKDEDYGILHSCSEGWHEGKNEIVPWWNYFLGILRSGYREFEGQVASSAPGRPRVNWCVELSWITWTGSRSRISPFRHRPSVHSSSRKCSPS